MLAERIIVKGAKDRAGRATLRLYGEYPSKVSAEISHWHCLLLTLHSWEAEAILAALPEVRKFVEENQL